MFFRKKERPAGQLVDGLDIPVPEAPGITISDSVAPRSTEEMAEQAFNDPDTKVETTEDPLEAINDGLKKLDSEIAATAHELDKIDKSLSRMKMTER